MKSGLEIYAVPAFKDNYLWVGRTNDGFTFVVDPGDSSPILQFLNNRGWTLDLILNTHHHPDHIGGNLELQQRYQCPIWGGEKDSDRLPGLDRGLCEEDHLMIGSCEAKVIFVPGHTRGHIAYSFETEKKLFVGDTLFGLGCGRLFEGSPAEMLKSLNKISQLPDDTLVYCAHEYTLSNLDFTLAMLQALKIEWPSLKARSAQLRALRAHGLATVPFLLGDEKKTNLFLNADHPHLKEALQSRASNNLEVFTLLRHQKDLWPAIDI